MWRFQFREDLPDAGVDSDDHSLHERSGPDTSQPPEARKMASKRLLNFEKQCETNVSGTKKERANHDSVESLQTYEQSRRRGIDTARARRRACGALSQKSCRAATEEAVRKPCVFRTVNACQLRGCVCASLGATRREGFPNGRNR